MPAHRLKPITDPGCENRTEAAVLAVLAGRSIAHAAAAAGIHPDHLADAINLYQTAGHHALNAALTNNDWYQVRIDFTVWADAEHHVVHELLPVLRAAEADDLVAWWYVRKAPSWRFRLRANPGASDRIRTRIGELFDTLVTTGAATTWAPGRYEAETLAFGGPAGIDIAHRLFHSDSRAILDYARRPAPPIGRRELSILFCAALMRTAGQEWHEQGDVWHRVCQLRPMPASPDNDRLIATATQTRRLLELDTGPEHLADGPLAFAAPWFAALRAAGRDLQVAAHHGTLERGLRRTLAHHVIFHWNRFGIPDPHQSILAHAARNAIMSLSGDPPAGHQAPPQ
jgi:thiopeptide-type bacteriocin biosynthesis protein